MRRLLLLVLMMVAACTNTSDSATTPTPQRPQERETLHISAAGEDLLSVVLDSIEFEKPPENADMQLIAILADGNGNPAYLLYPANQPGTPQQSFDFTNAPLQIETQASRASLWILAVENQAYPVVEAMGAAQIANQLAQGFDLLLTQATPPENVLAPIVSANENSLLRWLGTVNVMGELLLTLQSNQNWSVGENFARSRTGRFSLNYSVANEVASQATPTAAALPDCPGAPATTFQAGDTVVVDFNNIGALRVMTRPEGGLDTTIVQAYDDDQLLLLDGPICDPIGQDRWMWFVRHLTKNVEGWVSEGIVNDPWLCPLLEPECGN